jgi:hypothetical protein
VYDVRTQVAELRELLNRQPQLGPTLAGTAARLTGSQDGHVQSRMFTQGDGEAFDERPRPAGAGPRWSRRLDGDQKPPARAA